MLGVELNQPVIAVASICTRGCGCVYAENACLSHTSHYKVCLSTVYLQYISIRGRVHSEPVCYRRYYKSTVLVFSISISIKWAE